LARRNSLPKVDDHGEITLNPQPKFVNSERPPNVVPVPKYRAFSEILWRVAVGCLKRSIAAQIHTTTAIFLYKENIQPKG
jgi:hypothetical protein